MASDIEAAESKLVDEVAGEGDAGVIPEQKEYAPVYKKMRDSKIPVAKSAGKLWQSRRDIAISKRERDGVVEAWDECIRYYRNAQDAGKGGGPSRPVRAQSSQRLDSEWSETENIVFANVSALVPAIYAKNPDAEITMHTEDEAAKMFGQALERLLDVLATRKLSPGLNVKAKMKRAVVMAALTNLVYLEVGYTQKADSSETALADIMHISKELETAKDQNKIKELEGCLIALEERVDVLRPSGPWVKFRRPHDVLIDPDAIEADGSDANWMAIRDHVPTEYIRAVYGEKDKEGKWVSIYNPTKVLKIGSSGGEDGLDDPSDFHLIDWEGDGYSKAGYEDKGSYEKACRTEVWIFWDKVTRRVLMYNAGDMSWPIWVWDDPYHLDTFFPLVPLTFYTDPEDMHARSEVSYYLDQQDAINDINSELKRIRDWVKGRLFFNKNIIKDPEVVDDFLAGAGNERAVGVDVGQDVKLGDLFHSVAPPSAEFAKFFDKRPQMEAINRLSGVPQVMQGVEYKTNTTNKAIESYEAQLQTRLDDKMDAIEDCIGNVLWFVGQMCLQFMPREQVALLIGNDLAKHWQTLPPDKIANMLSLRVIGGSAIKPTSRAKKEQAMQMAQTLGQFASATPMVILIVLKMIQRSFDDVQITTAEWQVLVESLQMQLQRGNSTPGGGQPQPGQPPQRPQVVPTPPAQQQPAAA